MSFHLEGPWLSTTRTKARGERTTKAQREQLERDWRERNVRLRQMGLQKESFEQFLEWVYGRGKAMASEKSITSKVKASNHQESQEASKRSLPNSTPNTFGINKDTDSKIEDIKPKSLNSWVTGACSSKPSPTYTGTKIKGIAQMSKSNAIPIFTEEHIIDVAKMRR